MACSHSQGDDCPLCAVTLDGDSVSGVTLLRGSASGEHADPDLLQPGATVGRYIVLERLGAGGMGVVYSAHDPHLQRPVAIKLVRTVAGAGQSASAGQARLLREAQAMAQLAHSNVVQIYDSGPYGAGVFIAMELVRGQTLDLWLKERRRAWQELLAVFIEAGRGLRAAHEAGLVHRDFKPANVLMGDDGRPRITDFGLARATRPMALADAARELPEEVTRSGPVSLDEPLTQAGALMGSPGYMAPEQYSGAETSPATDQFAFCVSLYEALYGERPFVAKSLPELEVVTARGVVPPPPKGTKVPGWLRAEVLRGLAVEPQRRHPSMTVLLSGLTRERVQARRRWLAVAAVAGALASLVASSWYTSTQAARACRGADRLFDGVWDAAAKREARAAFVATGLPFAEASFEATSRALDARVADWVGARTEACEATRVRREQTERQLLLRLACLNQRRGELEVLAQAARRANASLVSAGAVSVERLTPLGPCANLRQLEDRRRPPPEKEALAAELGQQLAEGRALLVAGQLSEARDLLALSLAEAREASLPGVEGEAAEALGALHAELRDYRAARRAYEAAVRSALVVADDVAAARALAKLVSIVGWRLERPEEARTWAAIAAGVLARAGGDPDVQARLDEGLGDALWQAGQKREAIEAYRKALGAFLQLYGPENLDVARLRASIGWVLTEQGDLNEAHEELERSRAVRERILGPGHPLLASMWNELAMLARARLDHAEALRYARLLQSTLGGQEQGPMRSIWVHTLLAAELAHTGDTATALAEVERARGDVALLPPNLLTARLEFESASILVRTALGRHQEAAALCRAALALRQGTESERVTQGGDLVQSCVEPTLRMGKPKDAAALAAEFLEKHAAAGGQDTPAIGLTLALSAEALLALQRGDEARQHAERAVTALGRGHPAPLALARARFTLARAIGHGAARRDEAQAAATAALKAARAGGDEALARDIDAWLAAPAARR